MSVWIGLGSLAGFFLVQLVTIVWWASKLNTEHKDVEKRVTVIEDQKVSERLAVLESGMKHVLDGIQSLQSSMVDIKAWMNQQMGRGGQ